MPSAIPLQSDRIRATRVVKDLLQGPIDFSVSELLAMASQGGVTTDYVTDYVNRRGYDISNFPGVVSGVLANSTLRQANGVALQAALDYCDTNGLAAFLPAGRYEYEATGVQNSRNVGLQVKKGVRGFIGAGVGTVAGGPGGTLLIQYAVNHPVLTIGDISATVTNLTQGGRFGFFALCFGVSQAGQTSADGLLLGRICYSDFDQIYISSDIVGLFHPYVGLRVGFGASQFFFSNRVGSLVVRGGQLNVFRADSPGTGSFWENVYLGGGTFGNRVTLTQNAMIVNAPGSDFGTFGQLNIEWCSNGANYSILSVAADGFDVNHLHFEGNQLNGFDALLTQFVQARVNIGSVKALDTWIAAANASGTPRIFSSYSDSRIKVGQAYLRWGGSGYNAEAVASMAFRLYHDDSSIVGRRPFVEVGHFEASGNTGTFNVDSIITNALYGNALLGRQYVNNTGLGFTEQSVVTLASGVGTVVSYGVHRNVQIKQDTVLTADRTLTLSDKLTSTGIGSTVSRQPGDIVEVWRSAAATGAFNLNVRQADGTTLITAMGAANAVNRFIWTGATWTGY